MLAGLGLNPNGFEVEELLQATLRELAITSRTVEELRAQYVRLVCSGVADGTLDARDGLADLSSYWFVDCGEDLAFAVHLSHAIAAIEECGGLPCFHPDLRPDNVEATIRDETRKWLEKYGSL